MCTDDLDYQAWRRKARDPAFQAAFLAKPLAERRQQVRQMREKSKQVVQEKTAEIMDVNDEAVRQALRSHGVRRLIHGHTHRPAATRSRSTARAASAGCCPTGTGAAATSRSERGGPKLVRF